MENENEKTTVIGYKGFDKDWKCRDFQYEVGNDYETEEATLCKKGFHFCENPHDVFNYYAPGRSRFAVVEAQDATDEKEENDSKRVCKKIRIKAEISVSQLCKMAVSVFFERFGFKKKVESADTNNAGDYGAANAGYKGAANAGYKGAANAGDCGAANAGDYGAANAGNCGAANAGDYGAANAGYKGAANAGDYGAANAGYKGAANAGYKGAANAGNYGVAIVSNGGKVKGGFGCVLIARNIEWNGDNNRYEVTDWACGIVDGVNIKEDTWYRLDNGKLVEAEGL